MTELVWKKAWELAGQHEGNYQCLYNDRGNWTSGIVGTGKLKGTKYGISAMSYPKLDILNLTEEDAEKIFHDDYWVANKCYALPDALSVALFDYVVNSPAKQAIKDFKDIATEGAKGSLRYIIYQIIVIFISFLIFKTCNN